MRTGSKGSATVTLLGTRTIVCRLTGDITGEIVKGSMLQTEDLAQSARASGHAPLLLLDITQLTSQTSEARNRAKELSNFGFERIAICGGSRPVVMLGKYIARVAGLSKVSHFFKTETLAKKWLEHGDTGVQEDATLAMRSITALLIFILATAALVGWHLDIPAFKSLVPGLKAMNPVVAVTFIGLAILLASLGRNWRKRPAKRTAVLFAAFWCLIYGAIVIARYRYHIDPGFDSLLFASKLNIGEYSGLTAPGAGLGFTLVGVMLLTVASEQRREWQRLILFMFSTVIFIGAILVIIGYSFGVVNKSSFNRYTPVPLNTAICFLLFSNALAALARPVRWYTKSLKVIGSYWQAILVFLILMMTTGVIWQQTKQDSAQNVASTAQEAFTKVENTITSRLAAYSDALAGYSGLFAASDSVTPDDFSRYFTTTGLADHYPGFNVITYVGTVPDAQKQAFITKTRSWANADLPQYKNFSFFPENTNAIHYPLLFVEPHTASTRFGYDLSSETVRRLGLEEARDSGQAIASDIINLNASQTAQVAENPGFFLALPLYNARLKPTTIEARRAHIQGFMLAYFQNSRLFGDLFKTSQQPGTRYTVTDLGTNRPLYVADSKGVNPTADTLHSSVIRVGNKVWQLRMQVSDTFGKDALYRSLPAVVLVAGSLVNLLATALVFAQLRRRDQALRLAADMTEDLSTERNIAIANQNKDDAILSSIGDAVFAIDTDERITLFNEACSKMSGFSAEEAVGRPYYEVLKFLYGADNKANNQFIKKALSGHEASMKSHTILVRKDGKRVMVADSAAPIRDVQGKLLGVIVVFRDVSKEEELDRAKTEFVSLASHQLRTPLSAINWYSELLLSEDTEKLGPTQKEYVKEIYEGNQRMIELVNSLLDVSRLDLGKLANKPVAVDMEELASSLQLELATSIKGKKLIFTSQVEAQLPSVWADPKLLRMILQNLLSNAVKYTPDSGSVTLTMRHTSMQELHSAKVRSGRPYLFMSVTDTGYGIPKVQQHKIFGKLFRADNVQTLDVEGTGLGLYIVREVVEKLGGRVWFESIENSGSTFYVLLPFKTKAAEADDTPPSPA